MNNDSKILVYAPSCGFKIDLEKTIFELNVNACMIYTGDDYDPWVRDLFFEAVDGVIYLRSKEFTKNKIYYRSSKWDEDYIVTSNYMESKKYLSCKMFISNRPEVKSVQSIANQLNRTVRPTIRCVEGGNLFVAPNKFGELFYFIGINALLNEFDIQIFKKNYVENLRSSCNSNMLQLVKGLSRYKKIFGTDNVVALPQWKYHLDLQMAYIGQSTFLVHDLSKEFDFCRKNSLQEMSTVIRMPEEINKVTKNISNILKEYGFNVILCCASLHDRKRRELNENMVYPLDFSGGEGLSSSFVNGLDIKYDGKSYYLTMDSPNAKHKQYFTALMNDFGVDVRYLRMDNLNAEQTTIEAAYLKGSLRCQTNFINYRRTSYDTTV
jgi:hypothetical protein